MASTENLLALFKQQGLSRNDAIKHLVDRYHRGEYVAPDFEDFMGAAAFNPLQNRLALSLFGPFATAFSNKKYSEEMIKSEGGAPAWADNLATMLGSALAYEGAWRLAGIPVAATVQGASFGPLMKYMISDRDIVTKPMSALLKKTGLARRTSQALGDVAGMGTTGAMIGKYKGYDEGKTEALAASSAAPGVIDFLKYLGRYVSSGGI